MLIIRNAQKDMWFQRNEAAFVDAILKRVRELHPIYRQTDDMLRDSIRVGIKRARANGLETDRQISEFILIMFEVAPNFDQQKDIRRMLDDASIPIAERWERLFTPEFDTAWAEADSPSFLDANAWFEEAPKEISQLEMPTEHEWAELVAVYRIQQQTPAGNAVRDPTEEEIQRALRDIRARADAEKS